MAHFALQLAIIVSKSCPPARYMQAAGSGAGLLRGQGQPHGDRAGARLMSTRMGKGPRLVCAQAPAAAAASRPIQVSAGKTLKDYIKNVKPLPCSNIGVPVCMPPLRGSLRVAESTESICVENSSLA